MSRHLVDIAFGLHLSAGQKLTLIALAHFATDDGRVQVSTDKLQGFTGYGRDQVRRYLVQVMQAGFIYLVAAATGGGKANCYQLTLEAPYAGVVPVGDGKGGGR